MEQARAKNPVLTAVAVLAGCGICCLGIGGYLLRGCMTEHSRSHGLNDVSFRMAPSGEWMVFSGEGNGGRDLYRFDFDYRRVTQLTDSRDYESAPVVSPDGNHIAFARGVDGDRADHICILDLKTGKIKQLTSGDQNDTSPDFSPDGKQLIFTRETQYRWGGLASSWNEGGTIWVMNADGTAQAPCLDLALKRGHPVGLRTETLSHGRILRDAGSRNFIPTGRQGESRATAIIPRFHPIVRKSRSTPVNIVPINIL